MAGFEVTIYGRIWVTAKAHHPIRGLTWFGALHFI